MSITYQMLVEICFMNSTEENTVSQTVLLPLHFPHTQHRNDNTVSNFRAEFKNICALESGGFKYMIGLLFPSDHRAEDPEWLYNCIFVRYLLGGEWYCLLWDYQFQG